VTTHPISWERDCANGLFDIAYKLDKTGGRLSFSQERFIGAPAGLVKDRSWQPILANVESVELTFFDGQRWLQKWDYKDERKLPCTVRINITCANKESSVRHISSFGRMMKPRRLKTQQKGFVVVLVLCMVIMLTVLLFGFNRKSRANLRAVDALQKSKQALNCAGAGLNVAIAVVKDSGDIQSEKKFSDLLSGEAAFIVGDGNCSIIVTEENGKLNLNLLKDQQGRPDRTRIDQLLRLIDLLNQDCTSQPHIGYGLVPSVIDWTDSDDKVTCLPFIKHESLGAESEYYAALDAPYGCNNQPLESIDEMLLIKGVTPDIFDRLRDYVTVYGDGKININYAPRRVIESLSEKMDPALAQMIVDRRKIKPFDSVAELRDVPGMTDNIYNAIRNAVTISPKDRYYRVTSQGCVDRISCTIDAIFRRNVKAKCVELISYREL
jgi:general secretion pathway protein K